MRALKKCTSTMLIDIAKLVLNILSKQNTTHIAEQYVYALMGELYYNLQDIKNAKKYLLLSNEKKVAYDNLYTIESDKILKNIPSIM